MRAKLICPPERNINESDFKIGKINESDFKIGKINESDFKIGKREHDINETDYKVGQTERLVHDHVLARMNEALKENGHR